MGRNRSPEEEALEYVRLMESDEPETRRAARRIQLSSEAWRWLLDHDYVAPWILLNKHLPLDVLTVLANSTDPRTRAEVADKAAAAALLPVLAGDAAPSVRARVAWNRNVTPNVLERLASDPVPFVANAARRKLGMALVDEHDTVDDPDPDLDQ